MGTYESIMAGTEVQEVKARLRNAQEEYERRVAEIVGAEATGMGWDAPGFEFYKEVMTSFGKVCELISTEAAERIAQKVRADINKTD